MPLAGLKGYVTNLTASPPSAGEPLSHRRWLWLVPRDRAFADTRAVVGVGPLRVGCSRSRRHACVSSGGLTESSSVGEVAAVWSCAEVAERIPTSWRWAR